jgi:hypothetical protein
MGRRMRRRPGIAGNHPRLAGSDMNSATCSTAAAGCQQANTSNCQHNVSPYTHLLPPLIPRDAAAENLPRRFAGLRCRYKKSSIGSNHFSGQFPNRFRYGNTND